MVRREPRQTEDQQVAGMRCSHRLVMGHRKKLFETQKLPGVFGGFHFVRPEEGCLCTIM